jgi:hypothetical protein
MTSIFQSAAGLLVNPLFLAKGSLAAMSNDGQLLVSACPDNNTVQYTHLPTQSQKTICNAVVSAVGFRPNDMQYQEHGLARAIIRNEFLIARLKDNIVMRYIPSLDCSRKPLHVQEPTALACSATGQLLAVGTARGYIFIFDLTAEDQNPVFSSRFCPGPIAQVMFGIDGEHLFARDQDQNAYVYRLTIRYEECGSYLKSGGSVYLHSRITSSTGQAKRISQLANIFPNKVNHISLHPTIRQMALADGNRIYFWNYACATLSHFECPLAGPLTVFFCPDSDHFLVSSREGLAVYELARRQKPVATSTSAGGPYPVQYEIVLRAEERPTIFPSSRPGFLIRALVERDGACITACS